MNVDKGTETANSWLERMPTVVAVAAVGLVVCYAGFFSTLGLSKDPASWGQFSDYVGGLLNPFISLFTLTVAVKVWQLQKNELKETQDTLKDQLKTAEQQRAEARFFDLLNLHQLTLAGLSVSVEGGRIPESSATSFLIGEGSAYATVATGRAALRHIFSPAIRHFFISEKINDNHAELDDLWNLAVKSWEEESEQIDHYFRTVFMVLKEAQETLGKTNHFRYVRMFRAQLSREELALLAFNMLFDKEGVKMQDEAAKYGLLKHLPRNRLRRESLQHLNPSVFGRGFVQNLLVTTQVIGAPL